MSIKYLALSVLTVFGLLVMNTWIVLGTLKVFPNFLVANQEYIPQHKVIIDYLMFKNLKIIEGTLPRDQYLHIKDVKKTLHTITSITVFLSTILFALSLKYKPNFDRAKLAKYSMYLLGISSAVAVSFFEPFFIAFHKIFFPQGNWSFPTDSILIQLYPEQFWVNAFIILTLLTVAECLTVLYHKKNERTNTRDSY